MKQADYSKRIFQILSHIRVIVNNVRLYSLDHSQVETQLGQLFKEFIAAFTRRPEIDQPGRIYADSVSVWLIFWSGYDL